MASFHRKICWKRQRKKENKNYRSVSFCPDRQEQIPKKQQKKFKKLKNTITASFQAKIRGKMLRKKENKIIAPFRSFPKGKRNSKKIAKKFKILKNTITTTFQAKIGWKILRK